VSELPVCSADLDRIRSAALIQIDKNWGLLFHTGTPFLLLLLFHTENNTTVIAQQTA